MSEADFKLIKNLEKQIERLVEELKDLELLRNEILQEEYDLTKQEVLDQLKSIKETLDHLQSGNVSLITEVANMQKAMKEAIANSFDTHELLQMFGERNNETEQQLLKLNEELRLHKIDNENYEKRKIELIKILVKDGKTISNADKLFLDKMHNKILENLVKVEEN